MIQRQLVVLNQNRRLEMLNKQTDEHPPAKRPRFKEEAEESMDPMQWLREDELQPIMKYFKGMELLKLMEVSRVWKKFIENRSPLINRAMDAVVFKPEVNSSILPLVNRMFSDDRQKRPYKHMKSTFVISLSQCVNAMPIHYYAATLETLEIDDSEGKGKIEGCEFPRLKLLKYKGHRFELFKNFSCPQATHLELSDSGYLLTYDAFKESLYKFPNLTCLNINYWGLLFSLREGPLIRINQQDPLFIEADPALPKIEHIRASDYHAVFIKTQQNWLQVLDVGYITVQELSWLLRDLKVLKSLSIRNLSPGEGDLETNRSIEVLRIRNVAGPRRRFNTLLYVTHQQVYQRIFGALPSLKELVAADVALEMIHFIGKSIKAKQSAEICYQTPFSSQHDHLEKTHFNKPMDTWFCQRIL